MLGEKLEGYEHQRLELAYKWSILINMLPLRGCKIKSELYVSVQCPTARKNNDQISILCCST